MEKYNHEWFKDRALNSIKKVEDNVWDYSDSLLLYMPSGEEIYEKLQENDSKYFKMVTLPEHQYLKSIAKEIVENLPSDFDYIDLGPGTEHKEQYIFDEIKRQNKTFTYMPVDISGKYLDYSENYAKKQNIKVKRIKSSFEELPAILSISSRPRFVSIGLTFSNYEPQHILKLLDEIACKGGTAFINSHISDRVNMDELQKVYAKDAINIADEMLKLIGINPDKDVTPRFTDYRFEVSCKVLKSNRILESLGIKTGDKLIVFKSIRYTKESLREELKNYNHKIIDTGEPFISALINY